MKTFRYCERIGWTGWHDTTSMNNLYIWFDFMIPRISQCFVNSLEIRELLSEDDKGTVENSESDCANGGKFPRGAIGP